MNQSTQTTGRSVGRTASAASVAALVVALVGAAASPAAAQPCEPTGSEATDNVICGTVTNSDGTAVVGVIVTATFTDGSTSAFTDGMGFFKLESLPPDTHTVVVDTSTLPPGSVVTPEDIVVTVALDDMGNPTATPDQDFVVSPEQPPSDIWGIGTGTPGYWKNHPEMWPTGGITIGGIPYSTSAAIAKMGKVSGDKTISMFAALVSAILNTTPAPPPNNPACISATIASANTWMAAHPVGSNVKASSPAWAEAQEWHQRLDDYNNGKLCAPHRS